MVSDEALKKLQEQIAAWPMTQRFVVQQLIEDYRRNREDLRAYKATGLEPEEVLPKDKADEIALKLMRLADLESLCNYTRLRELAEADRDDRVVVLPCKLGDIVWANLDGMRHPRKCVIEFVNIGSRAMTIVFSTVDGLSEQYGVNPSAFGKTVFLTCERAKAALEAMKDE